MILANPKLSGGGSIRKRERRPPANCPPPFSPPSCAATSHPPTNLGGHARRSTKQDGEGEVVVQAVARGAGAAAERRARAAIQAREVPRPGGLLGQGMRVGGRPVFFLLLVLALLLLE
jgi:hypothetical protein